LKSKKLLDALNNTYSDIESQEEKSLRKKSKKYYAEKVKARKGEGGKMLGVPLRGTQ